MRLSAAALILVLQLPLPAFASGEVREQTITPLPADTEQRVEPVTPPDEQHVQALDQDGVQQVTQDESGPVRRGLGRVAKVAVGVLAAGVSLGVMVATLLFI